jgi:hypothetical protein
LPVESLPVVTVEVADGAGAIGAKAGAVPLESLIGGSVVADAGGGGAVEFTAGSGGGGKATAAVEEAVEGGPGGVSDEPGATVPPGGGGRASVVTLLDPDAGRVGPGVAGGSVSAWAAAPESTALPGKVSCWPTRIL